MAGSGMREYLSLEGHDQPVWTIAFSRDGKRLASGSLDQTARVWDTETASLLATINVGFPVVSLAFSPDGERLVTSGTNGTARIWNATNSEEVLTLPGQREHGDGSQLEPRRADDSDRKQGWCRPSVGCGHRSSDSQRSRPQQLDSDRGLQPRRRAFRHGQRG